MDEPRYYYVPVMIHMKDGRIIEAGPAKLNERQYIEFLKRNQNKEYYKRFKAKLNKKHFCDICGGSYTKTNISKHIQTKKHLKAVVSNNS
jgi:hypothetical protein